MESVTLLYRCRQQKRLKCLIIVCLIGDKITGFCVVVTLQLATWRTGIVDFCCANDRLHIESGQMIGDEAKQVVCKILKSNHIIMETFKLSVRANNSLQS